MAASSLALDFLNVSALVMTAHLSPSSPRLSSLLIPDGCGQTLSARSVTFPPCSLPVKFSMVTEAECGLCVILICELRTNKLTSYTRLERSEISFAHKGDTSGIQPPILYKSTLHMYNQESAMSQEAFQRMGCASLTFLKSKTKVNLFPFICNSIAACVLFCTVEAFI